MEKNRRNRIKYNSTFFQRHHSQVVQFDDDDTPIINLAKYSGPYALTPGDEQACSFLFLLFYAQFSIAMLLRCSRAGWRLQVRWCLPVVAQRE